MPRISQALANQPSTRRPRRIVTVSGRGVRGRFPSRKSSTPAQFQSLVEEMALRFLEAAPSVKSLATQPRVFEYTDGTRRRRYTPDVEIEIETTHDTVFLEVKDDRKFTANSEAATRLSVNRIHVLTKAGLIASTGKRVDMRSVDLLLRRRRQAARPVSDNYLGRSTGVVVAG